MSVTCLLFLLFLLLLLRLESYHNSYAQAEADYKQSFGKEFANLGKEHKNTIDAMGKASELEKVRTLVASDSRSAFV